MREVVAIAAGRLAAAASRALGAGGGTTLPGRIALALAPQIATHLSARLARGVALISGTNGKTTTSRLLGGILEASGLAIIHNRAGANLLSGITTALVEGATPGGRLRGEIGLFEVDEATLPAAVAATRPRAVILLNLFRDQLDRYGEIDLVADRWRRALEALPPASVLVYNGDDPLVADVGRAYAGPALVFGLDEAPAPGPDVAERGPGAPAHAAVPGPAPRALEHAADARYCYRCGTPYAYDLVILGHMGHYRCASCATVRPAPHVRITQVRLRGADGAALCIEAPGATVPVSTALPGLYNVYNAAAAAAGALALGLEAGAITRGIAATAPAFGRGEHIAVGDRQALMLLAKNPAGFNEVLRTVLLAEPSPVVLIAINDLVADGRDISWLWDVDFEMLRGRARAVVASGLRAEEMALRLKYAGVPAERVTVERDGARALARGLERLGEGERLYVLPTYTAMLHLRRALARQGHVRGFWRQ